jgi:hypothetical protein
MFNHNTQADSEKSTFWSGRRFQFLLFCLLLGLALLGMGLTESREDSGARYWLIVIWIYALVGLTLSWLQARRQHKAIWPEIHLHVFHWLGALVAMHIIFELERREILSRSVTSDFSMIILALTTYLAGLHFERMYVLIGIILALMGLIGAVVQQNTLWLIIIPASLIAAWLFLKSRHSQIDS